MTQIDQGNLQAGKNSSASMSSEKVKSRVTGNSLEGRLQGAASLPRDVTRGIGKIHSNSNESGKSGVVRVERILKHQKQQNLNSDNNNNNNNNSNNKLSLASVNLCYKRELTVQLCGKTIF